MRTQYQKPVKNDDLGSFGTIVFFVLFLVSLFASVPELFWFGAFVLAACGLKLAAAWVLTRFWPVILLLVIVVYVIQIE